MTRAIDNKWRMLGWAVMAVAAMALIAYNVWLMVQRRTLPERIAEMKAAVAQLEFERNRDKRIRRDALGAYQASRQRDKSLVAMMAKCTSRDDFIVREGPRLAWSELSGSPHGVAKLGIYVPAGRHWLKCSRLLRTAPRPSSELKSKWSESRERLAQRRFFDGMAEASEEWLSWELPAEEQVVEIEFRSGEDQTPRVSLIGADGARLFDEPLPVISGPYAFRMDVAPHSLMYPSQLLLDKEQRPLIRQRPPVSNLALVRVQKQFDGPDMEVDFRLWIESEAAACMPAVDAAAFYKQVTLLSVPPLDDPPRSMTWTDADRRFNRLFEPYDGSGRYYFRESLFSRETVNR
ncbi:MAG: hypothetical protein RIC55_31185 [Pirellulaceae bacterium]